MKARKSHRCKECGLPIISGEDYFEVVAGGGGLGWLKFPDRIHIECLDKSPER